MSFIIYLYMGGVLDVRRALGAEGPDTRGIVWKRAISASPPSGGRPRLVADHTHKEPCTKIATPATDRRHARSQRVPHASVSVRTMISSKLMLIAVGAGVVNALPVLTVPDAQEDRLVDLDSPASQVSIRFLNEDSPKAVLVKYTENGVLKQLHINAHSDTASYAVDPTKEITILGDYSPYYRVCTVAPGTLKEDDDAVSTAVQWGNVPCKVSRPSPSPAPAPSPSICQSPVGMGSMPDSIWKASSSRLIHRASTLATPSRARDSVSARAIPHPSR